MARLLLTVELPGVRGGRDVTLDVGEVSVSCIIQSPCGIELAGRVTEVGLNLPTSLVKLLQDRVVVCSTRQSYLLDIFLPHIVRSEDVSAVFIKEMQTLRLVLPLQ